MRDYASLKTKNKRIFLVVLDSFGIGAAPDAEAYGDRGCSTLGTIVQSPKFKAPALTKLGLFNIDGVESSSSTREKNPIGVFGRLQEQSQGKDTTIGHWELAGIVSEEGLPTYPEGFPAEIVEAFTKAIGRGCICNRPYSGTDVLRDYGRQHMETGKLIVYTSADSVFQIAAHEEVVPVETLYRYCEVARALLKGGHAVGRVIARPFRGEFPNFQRTEKRHDYALLPPKETMLDALLEAGFETYGIGKIEDIFSGQGIQQNMRTKNNAEGMEKMLDMQKTPFIGLCFINLVDFDMLYGHRNDIDGYAEAISEFDLFLHNFIPRMDDGDILMITADHGCDPGYPGTDHTREFVPFIAYGKELRQGVQLRTRHSFADVAATIQDVFGIKKKTHGESFMQQMYGCPEE